MQKKKITIIITQLFYIKIKQFYSCIFLIRRLIGTNSYFKTVICGSGEGGIEPGVMVATIRCLTTIHPIPKRVICVQDLWCVGGETSQCCITKVIFANKTWDSYMIVINTGTHIRVSRSLILAHYKRPDVLPRVAPGETDPINVVTV